MNSNGQVFLKAGHWDIVADSAINWPVIDQKRRYQDNSAVGLLVPHFKKTAPFDVSRGARLQADKEFSHLFC
ncbi:hypothetical protein NSP04_03510 [Limnobacter sp. YS8-69]|uniref:Uncharacterized protein n=1 Tax=Limnobacter parvus TaxID=2939690 RepID=A0ABT1XEY9_9BURK|nr:hypothetical protein [Limnobacter parvus]